MDKMEQREMNKTQKKEAKKIACDFVSHYIGRDCFCVFLISIVPALLKWTTTPPNLQAATIIMILLLALMIELPGKHAIYMYLLLKDIINGQYYKEREVTIEKIAEIDRLWGIRLRGDCEKRKIITEKRTYIIYFTDKFIHFSGVFDEKVIGKTVMISYLPNSKLVLSCHFTKKEDRKLANRFNDNYWNNNRFN